LAKILLFFNFLEFFEFYYFQTAGYQDDF